MSSPGNQVMYYLADRLERAFVKEELMLILQRHRVASQFCKNCEKGFGLQDGISSI